MARSVWSRAPEPCRGALCVVASATLWMPGRFKLDVETVEFAVFAKNVAKQRTMTSALVRVGVRGDFVATEMFPSGSGNRINSLFIFTMNCLSVLRLKVNVFLSRHDNRLAVPSRWRGDGMLKEPLWAGRPSCRPRRFVSPPNLNRSQKEAAVLQARRRPPYP